MASDAQKMPRREFNSRVIAGAAAATLAPSVLRAEDKPAILGGTPACKVNWPSWPIIEQSEVTAVNEVTRSGQWYRYAGNNSVDVFEKQWAEALGVPYCQATSSGTTSLITSLAALDIGPGDEVIVPPYTFIATINAVLLHHALPVFVDTDPKTGQMDHTQVASRVNGNTRCVIPVHIAGASCDMDVILETAKARNLLVLEDSCQTLTGEWKGKRLGGLGDAGCYSFQNSKNMTSGEGGALVTNREDVFQRANAYQNQGGGRVANDGQFTGNGANFRMPPFQGALLQQQLKRLEKTSRIREENAAYLSKRLLEIGGVAAKTLLPGTTRHGYHLYMFDYNPAEFAGMNKGTFLKALGAEGVPASGGYGALNKAPWAERMLNQRGFRKIYGEARLKQWREDNHLPANDKMLETTCWLSQTTLLADRDSIERIAVAIERIKKHAASIVKA